MNNADAMNAYRARWTKETDTMRGVRFQSEQCRVMGEGVDKDFIIRQTRIMPGVPLAVEKVRSIMFSIGGVHGIRNLQRMFLALDDEVALKDNHNPHFLYSFSL